MSKRKRAEFVNMSAQASVGVAAAWSGAVTGLLLVMIAVRSFS